MDVIELIHHPEHLDRDTLYELRSLLALYPYYQTARLLMLQNLYLLHDPTFDEELRRAAIYITDRRVLFQMIEAAHYQLRKVESGAKSQESGNRTLSLIDNFLESMPQEGENKDEKKKKRKPTPADAAVDYVAYLMETEGGYEQDNSVPEMKGQNLIDSFINSDKGRIVLSEEPQYTPQLPETTENDENASDEGYFTETLARIYIKQGRYSKALEIIRRLSLVYPKKNAYFADQIRFLEKNVHIISNYHGDCSTAHDRHRAHSGVKGWRSRLSVLWLQPDWRCPQDHRLHREDHMGPRSRYGHHQRVLRLCCSPECWYRLCDGEHRSARHQS